MLNHCWGPPAAAGAREGRRAAEPGTEHQQVCPSLRLARGGERGALTDVGVLQEAADPGFAFQLLVI